MPLCRDTVLVTGGNGFLGANLVRSLLADGFCVHLLLRRATCCRRLAGFLEHCTVHWTDIRDARSVRQAVRASHPHVVYHLAAAGVRRAEPQELEAVNVQGTRNLLAALASIGDSHLVHVGSGAEYGSHQQPIPENAPLAPETEYARTKAEASSLCLEAAQNGQRVTIVRVFCAYGPLDSEPRLVPYLLDCCRRNVTPLLSIGTQLRDYVYVDDVVSLLRMTVHCPNARGRVLHAASSRAYTVCDIVRQVLSICACDRIEAAFGALPLRAGEPACYLGSIKQTREQTGWQPVFDLSSGVRATWHWLNACPRVA